MRAEVERRERSRASVGRPISLKILMAELGMAFQGPRKSNCKARDSIFKIPLLGGKKEATYESLLIANMLYKLTFVARPQSRVPINLEMVKTSVETLFQLIVIASKPRKIPRYLIAKTNWRAFKHKSE